MRNLLDFLSRHGHWLLFALLEAVSAVLVFRYNTYQGSVWLTSANAVAGKVYEGKSALTSFFALRQNNGQLTRRNFYLERQVEQLARLYARATHDTMAAERANIRAMEQYRLVPAQVVAGTTHRADNLLTIDRGRADGIAPDMGVVSGMGVVGVVLQVSDHYAIVLPVINSRSRVSCTIRRRGYFGVLRWYGGDPSVAYVEDIPRHAHFRRGDWVETNGYSSIFPPGVPVGKIVEVYNSRDGMSYRLKVWLANDFGSLRDVNVVTDKGAAERVQLLKAAQDSLRFKDR